MIADVYLGILLLLEMMAAAAAAGMQHDQKSIVQCNAWTTWSTFCYKSCTGVRREVLVQQHTFLDLCC
jgi:hypothetical protein